MFALSSLIFSVIPILCWSIPHNRCEDVLSFTKDYFAATKCHCVFVLRTTTKGTPLLAELEQFSFNIAKKTDSSWPSQVALLTFSEYSTKLLERKWEIWGTCFKALHIVFVGDETKEDFKKLSQSTQLVKSLWLVFLNHSDVEQFFEGVNLPYNAGVYIASPQETGEVVLTEVYRVSTDHPLKIGYVGHWNSKHEILLNEIPRDRRRSDLDGLTLRTGALESWPMSSFVNGRARRGQELDGFFAEVWYELEKRMNFTSIFRSSRDNIAGTLGSDGNWTGLIGMLHMGEIDVILSQLDYNTRRLDVVQHLLPILHSRFQVYFKDQGYLVDWMGPFRPFSDLAWVSILLWIIIASTSLTIFCKLCLYYGLEEHQDYTPTYAFFFVLQAISFQGCPRVPKVWACRLVFLMCYVAAAVLIPSYSASLISSLTKKSPVRPFDSLEDLQKKSNFYLLTTKGGSTEYFMNQEEFNNSMAEGLHSTWTYLTIDCRPQLTNTHFSNLTFSTLPYIYLSVLAFNNLPDEIKTIAGYEDSPVHNAYLKLVKPVLHLQKEIKEPKDYLQYVCDHSDIAFFGSEASEDYRINIGNYCPLLKFSQPLAVIHQSMALVKNSPLTDVFNYNLLRMSEEGVIDRELDKFLRRWAKPQPEVVAAISMDDISEAFIFLFASFGLSLLLLLLEKMTTYLKKRASINVLKRSVNYVPGGNLNRSK